jgi:hypothetical protein
MLIAIGSTLKDRSEKVWEVIDITVEGRETSIHMQFGNLPKVISPDDLYDYELV